MQATPQSVIDAIVGAHPDAMAEGPFAIDGVLPAQFARSHHVRSGEQRLMLAVLEDAINCFFGDESQARMEATLWFKDRGASGPFAFEAICQALALNAGWLRRGLFTKRSRIKAKNQMDQAEKFSRAA